jgi:dihydroflavonol-4-reductase
MHFELECLKCRAGVGGVLDLYTMKVLVTGATGFLGGALVRAFTDRGTKVTVLVRKPDAVKKQLYPGVTFLEGDIARAESLPAFPMDIDCVIHAAGMLGHFRGKESVYRLVNTAGTANVLNSTEAANIKRFLFVSSAGVLGPIKKPPADENWPLAPSNGYERSKAAAERLVKGFYNEGRLRTVTMRPEFIYGPSDLHTLGFFRAIRDRKFFLIGSGETLLHPTYIDDAVQGILGALEHDAFAGSEFLLAGPKPVSVRELMEVTAGALGVEPREFRVPRSISILGAAFFECIGRITSRDVPLTFSRVRFFTENRAFRTDRAASILGYIPRLSIEDGIGRTIEWYRRHNLL